MRAFSKWFRSPKPADNSICQACTKALQDPNEAELGTKEDNEHGLRIRPQHYSFADLQASAELGCLICETFWERVSIPARQLLLSVDAEIDEATRFRIEEVPNSDGDYTVGVDFSVISEEIPLPAPRLFWLNKITSNSMKCRIANIPNSESNKHARCTYRARETHLKILFVPGVVVYRTTVD